MGPLIDGPDECSVELRAPAGRACSEIAHWPFQRKRHRLLTVTSLLRTLHRTHRPNSAQRVEPMPRAPLPHLIFPFPLAVLHHPPSETLRLLTIVEDWIAARTQARCVVPAS